MKVLFPGSFDPIHEGHLKIIERASRIFDEVVVLIAQNPQKKSSDIIKRKNKVKETLSSLNFLNVKVDFWNGQVMEYFEKYYFDVVIRSIRNCSDLDWEKHIANEYKKENIDCDVLYFFAENSFSEIKSSQYVKNKNSNLFVFDIDGTILNDEKKISRSVKRVFQKLKENGHIILIATGRIPSQTLDICKELNFNGYVLGSNGASIYDIKNNDYEILQDFIPVEDIELLIQKAYQMKKELIWTNGKKIYRVYFGKNLKKEIKEKLYFIGGELSPKYDNWEECKHTLNDGVIQISIKAESWIIKQIKKELNQKISKKVVGVVTSQVYYQINSSKINKYKAIQKFQKKYFINNNYTYAFGDSENDKEMIQNVGHGIAMGNSIKILKNIAKEVIGNNNSESIEDYLIKKGFISE